jgi:hypothetical protein
MIKGIIFVDTIPRDPSYLELSQVTSMRRFGRLAGSNSGPNGGLFASSTSITTSASDFASWSALERMRIMPEFGLHYLDLRS